MIGTLILTFLLLHIAAALAIGFWLLMTSMKQEGWLKSLGTVFAWLIIALAILLMLTSTVTGIRFMTDKEYRKGCPMREMMRQDGMQQKMMNQDMMQQQSEK
ncbi:MAG: hypothetical protein A2Y25_03190 [Candidatus Melainabacteria bacterium GWF2_37_15]|nr:MAG: hypothetical protein A2Y25_03190 [Candidatus Melainabacteria bacterium GWF2_37_15]